MAYFPYVTFRSDITFPVFFAVLQIPSRFVNLSQDDITNFCDEQENENTARKTIYDIAFFKEFLAILKPLLCLECFINYLNNPYNKQNISR